MKTITADALGPDINWPLFIDAIDAGHTLPPAQIKDTFLGPPGQTLLSRAAWIKGLGFGVKSVTVMAGNTAIGLPTVQGAMQVFDEQNGALRAVIASDLVTNLKTAADSALGARYLARPDSRKMLVIGAGKVAANVIAAYSQTFPDLTHFMIWNRTGLKAKALADELGAKGLNTTAVDGLEAAVAKADIITTATMSTEPVLKGDWVQPGTHVDLIGAFRAEMREADDALLQKARLFVDSRDTTLHHIGEIKIPLEAGTITEADILADLHQLKAEALARNSADDITVFKNGGGAHLDLMTACAILDTRSVSDAKDNKSK